jgi:hypothetical protein
VGVADGATFSRARLKTAQTLATENECDSKAGKKEMGSGFLLWKTGSPITLEIAVQLPKLKHQPMRRPHGRN